MLDLCEFIINSLADQEYILSEGEAALFLPILCEKSGNNNATLR